MEYEKNNSINMNNALRIQVWSNYFNLKIGETTCPCCEYAHINQIDFKIGNIAVYHERGGNYINDLIPLCGGCFHEHEEKNLDHLKIKKDLSESISMEIDNVDENKKNGDEIVKKEKDDEKILTADEIVNKTKKFINRNNNSISAALISFFNKKKKERKKNKIVKLKELINANDIQNDVKKKLLNELIKIEKNLNVF